MGLLLLLLLLILRNLASHYYYEVLLRLLLSTSSVTISSIQTTPGDRLREAPDSLQPCRAAFCTRLQARGLIMPNECRLIIYYNITFYV
jgi:hypothetical protein